MMHTSVAAEIEAIKQAQAELTLSQLVQWLREQGHEELVDQLLAAFSSQKES